MSGKREAEAMRHVLLGTVLVAVGVQGCVSEQARVTETSSQAPAAAGDAEILLSQIKSDKKRLVAGNMDLTEEEAKRFWPFYDLYQQDLERVDQRLERTLDEYAQALKSGPLPGDKAEKLLEEALAVEEEEVALKQSYAERMGQILPPAKVARYLQIETKLRSLFKYDLARLIPLVY
ncbi:MAG TPA: hypothetical protein VJ746_05350 [Nitrospira sp.]|nr:hypothetical protein [Nitrospira sp.]